MQNKKNVLNYVFGNGTYKHLEELLTLKRRSNKETAIIFVDHFFRSTTNFLNQIDQERDLIFYIDSNEEPSTDMVDSLVNEITEKMSSDEICALVGIGGGVVLDVTKAVSNLLTNSGKAEDYQGWDLVKNPGVYKIGIPTISGTGAECSRTCVMMNVKKNLKLGMNSDYTIYDQLILDPSLTKTVERNQYFYTGMDSYIHCLESLNGSYRNGIGDVFSEKSIELCREVFSSEEMMSDEMREKMMLASYFGGCAVANSLVGVVHPFSAGLSVVLGIHHCLANCIVMNVMEDFYPEETKEFKLFMDKQKIELPKGITDELTDAQFDKLYLSTIIHEKPLENALGANFKTILTKEVVIKIFRRM